MTCLICNVFFHVWCERRITQGERTGELKEACGRNMKKLCRARKQFYNAMVYRWLEKKKQEQA